MAKNDYHVVLYYLLTYLYHCLKRGKPPESDIVLMKNYPERLHESYVSYIIEHAQNEGLIEGADILAVSILGHGCQTVIKNVQDIAIIPAGIEYLQVNSTMERAKETVKAMGGVLSMAIQAFV